MAMDASKYNQDMLLKQAQSARATGEMISGLGDRDAERMWKRVAELERSGVSQRELQQRYMDMEYENYMRQQDFAKQQLSWLQSIISGAPGVAPSGQYTNRPSPSIASQMAGLGIGAAGIKNLLDS